LDAVANVELGVDVREVGLDGRLAEEQRFADLAVREAARDELEDLELACGELGDLLGQGIGGRRLDPVALTRSSKSGTRC